MLVIDLELVYMNPFSVNEPQRKRSHAIIQMQNCVTECGSDILNV